MWGGYGMQIVGASSVYLQKVTDKGQNQQEQQTEKISLTADYTKYVHAVRDGYIEEDGVRISISDEARDALEKLRDQWQELQDEMNAKWILQVDQQAAERSSKSMQERTKDQARAMEIARRIAKGGRVPPRDEQTLLDYSSDLYQMAKQAGMLAKKHKKYKKALTEDEKKTERTSTSEDRELAAGPERCEIVMEIQTGEGEMADGSDDAE